MDDSGLLHVPVVGLAFQPGQSAVETLMTAHALDSQARLWAVAASRDAAAFRKGWQDSDEAAFLIVHAPCHQALTVACDLLALLPAGPVALLLANLPEQSGLFKSRRHGDEVVRRLKESRTDLQVHVYSTDWMRRPPRLR